MFHALDGFARICRYSIIRIFIASQNESESSNDDMPTIEPTRTPPTNPKNDDETAGAGAEDRAFRGQVAEALLLPLFKLSLSTS